MANTKSLYPSVRSSSTLDIYTDSPSITAQGESEKLLWTEETGARDLRQRRRYLQCLWASNVLFMISTFVLAVAHYKTECRDPSLGVYSPASEAVSYIPEHRFEAALATHTDYMGAPNDEIDRRWEDLFQYNRSVITKEEAQYLSTPTMTIPGTEDYLITLEVFHNLHCLNELRKLLWPDRYRMLQRVSFDNGTINTSSFGFRHWDHCVDSLRQALTCNADVAPVSWHVNVPFNRGIYPRLASTHTCRDFSQIQKWAKEHKSADFQQRIYNYTELQQVIDGTDIDHSTEEDLDDQYMLFPGDKYFKHWREHPYEGVVERPQIYPTSNHTWDE
ncbi:hypothetical protein TI39_contig523g00003 [Zymoseptoria brevis]|uniref:Uncharacterized protein n=1 Tax=Zymoseptoria brevis TaxID=1047168 RepID=A0A0F4GLZ7_9PEZI|nr:hypothetical protein TI39_contig523g00003 [Zymoseptoria brevis]